MANDPITAILDIGGKILDRVIPDPVARAAAQEKLLALPLAELAAETQLLAGQLEVNKVEAANPNLWVSGGRPAVIWVGVFSLGYQTILYPFMQFIAILCGWAGPAFPVIDNEILTYVILPALLGVAGMRSYDKRGKNKNG